MIKRKKVRFIPERAFPEEIVEDLLKGVPEPVLYSGPLYRGGDRTPAVERVEKMNEMIEARTFPDLTDAELIALTKKTPLGESLIGHIIESVSSQSAESNEEA